MSPLDVRRRQGPIALFAALSSSFVRRSRSRARVFSNAVAKSPWPLAVSACIAAAAPTWAQTAPFSILDNVEGDFVSLNAPPVRPMVLDANDTVLFALNTHASRIVKFDTSSGATTQVIHTAKSPVSIALWTDPNATTQPQRLLVACRDTYALLVHDRVTGDVVRVLELRDLQGRILGEPGDLLVDQTANRAFVSCQAADAVAEVNLTSMTVARVFRLPGKNPLFMCFDASRDVLVAPLLSGNNSGPRRSTDAGVNPMHQGPTVVDFKTAGLSGAKLPDNDLFRLVRATGAVEPATTEVGTVLFACGINPYTGQLWQLNTDANNKDSTRQTEESIRGDIVRNQLSISTLAPAGQAKVAPSTIVDLDTITGTFDPTKSVGQPYALAFGQFGYAVVCGLLTNNVMLLSPAGAFVDEFDLAAGAIPRGLLYSPVADRVLVHCWGTNTVDVRQVAAGWPRVFDLSLGLDPTPAKIKDGRTIAYSAQHSQRNNASCLSCHVDGRTDMVAWNLGSARDDKGPMVTQTLDGIEKAVPFHWRGEQLNNLVDFNAAFVKLLGAPAVLTPVQFRDFEAFVFSLQAPPNPFENEERLVDNSIQPPLLPGSLTAKAVNGQTSFIVGCAGCHTLPTGTSNDLVPDGASFGNQNPRRQFFKIAPLNEHYKKEQDSDPLTAGTQFETIKLAALSGGGTEALSYPLLGSGFLHAGAIPSLHSFVEFFQPLGPEGIIDVTAFAMQFDQGIAPAAYRAVHLDQASSATASTVLQNFFVPQALARHCDLALFGRVTLGGAATSMRWWFDRRLAGGQGLFVAEDGTAQQPLSFFVGQAGLGQASVTCVGLPVGTGEGFGIDFDRDGLPNRKELNAVPALDPDDADSDGDGWLDGHEYWNGGNPNSSSVGSNDTTPPVISRAVTQFVTGKVARINVETNEPCILQATYSFAGGPIQSKSTSVFAETHSLLLQDLLPSRIGSSAHVYTGTITVVDLGGRASTPQALPTPAGSTTLTTKPFNDNLGVAVVGNLTWTATPSANSLTISATVTVHEKVKGPPAVPLPGQHVIARVFKNGVLQTMWTASGGSSKHAIFEFSPPQGRRMRFTGLDGPFLVSPLTGTNGQTSLDFQIGGLTAGVDEVTLELEFIGQSGGGSPPLFIKNGNVWNMASTPEPFRHLTVPF